MVGHQVGGSQEVPEISFDIVGSTGNLYKTIIGKVPSCDCPDGLKGNQCKHICYGMCSRPGALFFQSTPTYLFGLFLLMACQVLLHALKAPGHLQYQLAFLSSVSCTNNPE